MTGLIDQYMISGRLDLGERRMEICRSCPNYIKIVGTCAECGCFMPAKTKMKSQSCPIGKWEKEN